MANVPSLSADLTLEICLLAVSRHAGRLISLRTVHPRAQIREKSLTVITEDSDNEPVVLHSPWVRTIKVMKHMHEARNSAFRQRQKSKVLATRD